MPYLQGDNKGYSSYISFVKRETCKMSLFLSSSKCWSLSQQCLKNGKLWYRRWLINYLTLLCNSKLYHHYEYTRSSLPKAISVHETNSILHWGSCSFPFWVRKAVSLVCPCVTLNKKLSGRVPKMELGITLLVSFFHVDVRKYIDCCLLVININ